MNFYAIGLCFFLTSFLIAEASVKVLFTTAIIRDKDHSREKDYIRNLKNLKAFGCDVYVVESCQVGPTFLDEYCDHVCYTKSNDLSRTKSFNEVTSMFIGMQYFNFSPEDMIIKVTGRYVFEDDQFIAFVNDHLEADIIARIWNEIDAYTGYFAIRQRCFVEMIGHYYQIYNTVSKGYAVEHALGNYLTMGRNNLSIVPIPRLYNFKCAREALGRK